jgi:hypothetical protein
MTLKYKVLLNLIRDKHSEFGLKSDEDIIVFALSLILNADLPIFDIQRNGKKETVSPTVSKIK